MSRRALIYHAQCFDGVVSCAIAWEYLERTQPVAETELRPIGYEIRDQWLSTPLAPGSAVVDFLFHPDAEFWADHHGTTFLTDQARTAYESSARPEWLYDGQAKSCAGLLQRHFAKAQGPQAASFEQAAAWADRLDSADYDSVEQAVLPREAPPLISLSFAARSDPAYSIRLVRLLREVKGDFDAIVTDAEVSAAVFEAKSRVDEGIRVLRKGIEENNAEIITFDVEAGDALIPRYGPYLVNPIACYSAGIVRHGGQAKITTMRNPWKEFRGVNLGQLCARFGGGGHERVGSILVREGSNARTVLNGIVEGIRGGSQFETRVGGAV